MANASPSKKPARKKPAASTMADLIEEQLAHLRDVIDDLEEWYWEGADFEAIDFGDDVQREACAFAWGYIRGCAEISDVTVSQLLEGFDLSFNEAR